MVAITPHTRVGPALGVAVVVERTAFPALLAALRA